MANGMNYGWIDKLRDSVDIVDVVGDYVSLKPKGHRHWACCPFHNEKTPSFEVDSRSQMYYCFGCHKGGNVFNFVMEMERLQIPVNSDYFFPANPLMEGTYDNIVSILEMSGNFPTAIVTDNDTSAVGMLNAFKRKYEVPEKISIVGMGDTFYCRLSSPSITVVQIHAYDIGRKAVKMLHERANNLSAPICKVSIGGELVPRNSVKTLW